MKMKFDLSRRKGSQIKSLVVRETTGADEEVAAGWAKAKGGTATVVDGLVRISIVEVDGKAVEQPYGPYDKWNSRTRQYATVAWRMLNIVEDDDLEDFRKAGQVTDS